MILDNDDTKVFKEVIHLELSSKIEKLVLLVMRRFVLHGDNNSTCYKVPEKKAFRRIDFLHLLQQRTVYV